MQDQATDGELMENWRRGDEAAATVLYQRYLQKLLNLVGQHLSRKFNPRFDPEDVVQSVFHSLFRRARAGDFTFQDDADFWKLLLTIALNKVRNKVRYHQAEKRNPSREAPAQNVNHRPDEYILNRLSHNPTALESVSFADLFTVVLDCLEPREQQLIHYRLEQYTQQEMAQRLNVDERTVRRMFVRIRQRVVDRFGDGLSAVDATTADSPNNSPDYS
jgi:RNA polymerase sigma factor (sigma-70 family)